MDKYKGFTIQAIEQAFNAVKDPRDWKAPISTTVPKESKDLVVAAIEFYTATIPVVAEMINGHFAISSEGYRNGPAGDH